MSENSQRNMLETINKEILKKCTTIEEAEESIPFFNNKSKMMESRSSIGSLFPFSIIGCAAVSLTTSSSEKMNLLRKINISNKNESNVNNYAKSWNKFILDNSIDEIMEKINFNTFSIQRYLWEIKDYYNMTYEEICEKSNFKETYLKPVFLLGKNKSQRAPKRDCIIGLAFAFELNIIETNYLLAAAGYNELYLRDQKDIIITKCIVDGKNIRELNECLEKYSYDKIGNLDKEEGVIWK